MTETCNPEDNWKNHGEYVSCVAKLKQGGQTTSEAAQSDVGKKNGDEDKSEGEAPSGSPTASPAAGIPDAVYLELKALTEVFKNILETLQKLYTN